MTNQLSLPLARPALALGICLGARHAGLALATRERLVRASVANLGKRAVADRDERFAEAVSQLLDAYGVTRIALVSPRMVGPAPVAIARQAALLDALAGPRTVPVARYDADQLRVALGGGTRPSTRNLAEALAHRFPELASRAPSAEPIPGADKVPGLATLRRRRRTPRARYWSRMFLALAGALHDLDEELKSRVLPELCPPPASA